jgi:polyhydroxyalkanoate synthesis regulator phasin
MSTHSDYIAKMEAQLQKWDADVDALVARGKVAGTEARAAYDERIRNLRTTRDAAQKTLHEIRQATESASTQMKAAMQGAWEAMQKALEKAASDIRN